MEDEKFLSGYCRQIDGSRTVTVELENGNIDHVDCGYENLKVTTPIDLTIAKMLLEDEK